MRRIFATLLASILILLCTSCTADTSATDIQPQVGQMKSICELSVMKCYYHNVAKYYEENATGWGPFAKDKHFWIEYSGIVELGIDASQLNIEINDTQIIVTLPAAKILSCTVDSSSLVPGSYIVAKDSAKVTAEDEIWAFQEAQAKLQMTAESNTSLFQEAQQRAEALLTDYIKGLSDISSTEYTIQYVYLNADNTNPSPISTPLVTPDS